MSKREVQVIVPYWHGERTIARALRSIVAAAGTVSLSVVVVDDGSSPESAAALAAVVAVGGGVTHCEILSIPHGGGAGARSAGLRASDSELVAFCDQDDEWLAGRLETQLALLDDDPSLAFVTGPVELAVEDGYRRPSWCRPEWLERPQAGTVLGALLVRRHVFGQVGDFDPALTHGSDDVDWLARARRLGLRNATVEQPVLRRWVHDHNASADRAGSRELLAVVRRHARGHVPDRSPVVGQ